MEDLNKQPANDDLDQDAVAVSLDPTDDLAKVIRLLCEKRDKAHREIDPDEVLKEIQDEHPQALLRRGNALALKACRRMITGYLRRMSAMDPEEDEPQLVLPGLVRVATHISYAVPIPNSNLTKIVARNTRDATLAQHQSCLQLKQTNTLRCIEREGDQQKIIDLLAGTGCDSIREWEERFGQASA